MFKACGATPAAQLSNRKDWSSEVSRSYLRSVCCEPRRYYVNEMIVVGRSWFSLLEVGGVLLETQSCLCKRNKCSAEVAIPLSMVSPFPNASLYWK